MLKRSQILMADRTQIATLPRFVNRRDHKFLRVALMALALIAVSVAGVAAQATAKPVAKKAAAQTLKKGIWGEIEFQGRSLFPTYKQLGVGIYNSAVRWDQIAPSTKPLNPTDPKDPAYQWPAYVDQIITDATANGIQVQLMIIGTPPWANGGKSFKWAATNPKDYGDFATAISKKYPSVRHWMIWGEPSRLPNFGPFVGAKPTGPLTPAQAQAPRVYSQLLDAAYEGLKSVNPNNLVIGGNTYTSAGPGTIHPLQWIKYMTLPDGSRPRMDMYGHNPFGYRQPNFKDPPSPKGRVDFSDVGRFMKALDRTFPGPPLKIYLAEWGVPAGRDDLDLQFHVSFKEQVKWIRAGYRIARTNRRIYSLGWVHPIDTPRSPQGLLNAQGKPNPAFNAYKSS